MRCVEIAADHNTFAFGHKLIYLPEKEIIKFELIFQSLLRGFAVGKIDIEKQKVSIVRHYGSVLVIKSLNSEGVFHAHWQFFGDESHTVAAFSNA
ncbi:Uncharacterised protein [uncultured archaeon]|nr:Uncharacterised protein [uncultured archaeon]